MSRVHKGCAAILFLGAFLSYGFFINGEIGANAVVRMALTLSLIERGEVGIDRFAPILGDDKAQHDGRLYSDKAPGMSFLALPAAYLGTRLMAAPAGQDPWISDGRASDRFRNLTYLCGLLTSGLLGALGVVALFMLALRRTGQTGAAVVAALAYGLGTPSFGWATSFFSHAAAGGLLISGFALLDAAVVRRRGAVLAGGIAGLVLGFVVCVEYTAAPASLIILLHGFAQAVPARGWRGATRLFMAIGAAAVLAVLPLLAYNTAAFGSPFHLGYSDVQGFAGMRSGFFGIAMPQLSVLHEILIGPTKGLLRLSPILVLTPFALVMALRDRAWRGTALVVGAIALWYLVLNAGYFYWDGGASAGPRHLTPMLPFLCLPLALLWRRASRAVRLLTALLLAASVVLSLVCVSVDMLAQGSYADLLRDYMLPRFAEGRLDRVAKRLFGLSGIASLAPLLAVWAALAGALAAMCARRGCRR